LAQISDPEWGENTAGKRGMARATVGILQQPRQSVKVSHEPVRHAPAARAPDVTYFVY
jgi:ABC-type transport system involved in cytochrome c biogenesis ATPase subunit